MSNNQNLSFFNDIDLGFLYTIDEPVFGLGIVGKLTINIYAKSSSQYIISLLHDSRPYLYISYNKNILEFAFSHISKDSLIGLNGVKGVIHKVEEFLTQNFKDLKFSKIKMLDKEEYVVYPPFVFANEEIITGNLYYKQVKLQIPDLDLNAVYTGHIIRKNNTMFYMVVDESNDIISLLKLKYLNESWSLSDSCFKDVEIDANLILTCFGIPLPNQKDHNEDRSVKAKQDTIAANIPHLNIFI